MGKDKEKVDAYGQVQQDPDKQRERGKEWWKQKIEYTPEKKTQIKQTLRLYIILTVSSIVMGVVSTIIYSIFRSILIVPGLTGIRLTSAVGVLRGIRGILWVLFASMGLILAPIRYGYIKGLIDIIRGEPQIDILYYLKNREGFKKILGLELTFYIFIYLIESVNGVWGVEIFTIIAVILWHIARVAILTKQDNLECENKEIIQKAIDMIVVEYKVLLIILVPLYIVMMLLPKTTLIIVYVQDMLLTIVYYINTQQENKSDERTAIKYG